MIGAQAFKDGYARLAAAFPFMASKGKAAVYAEYLCPVMNERTWAATVATAILTRTEVPTIADLLEAADKIIKDRDSFAAAASLIAHVRMVEQLPAVNDERFPVLESLRRRMRREFADPTWAEVVKEAKSNRLAGLNDGAALAAPPLKEA